MKSPKLSLLFLLLCLSNLLVAQTSWRGTVSTAWENASNWTSGVPTSATDATIGDASFTGSFQPTINESSVCRSLTVGGNVSATVTVNKNLTIAGNLTIQSNGNITENKTTITIAGNWINNGTYTTNNNSTTVIFNGIAQTIGGTNSTTFRRITINSGSTVTLANNVSVSGQGAQLTVSGTINPNEAPTYMLTASSGATTINASGVLKVNASTLGGNYNLGTVTVLTGFTIDYSSTTTNQTISSTITYSTLRISGSGTKALNANTTVSGSSSTGGIVNVVSGTLDLSTFTLDRQTTTTGGTISVANGATVRVGGTANFPNNYANVSLALASNVEYYANNQSIAARTYGNLLLTGTSGTVVKTMPATAITVQGNFSSTSGTATTVSYTAAAALTFNGNVSIGAATTFDGSSFSHTVAGNLSNAGTLTGNTSTLNLTGANMSVSGSGTYNFSNLVITGSGITASSTNITIGGNLSTSGSGSFTHASGGTVTMNGSGRTISGTGLNLHHLNISGSTTSADYVTVSGDLIISGSFTNTGTTEMTGTSRAISGTGTKTFGTLRITGSVSTAVHLTISSLLNVSGTLTASAGTTTFSGTSVLSGTANLFNIAVSGTSFQLANNATLGIAGSFNITSGIFDVTSGSPNSVNYNGTGNQSITATTYHHLLLSGGNTKTAAGSITTNGNLSIGAATTFNASSFTHIVKGNWTSTGTFTASTSTIEFTGSMDATITGTAIFNNITVNKSSNKIIWLSNNVSVTTINMTNGTVRTGSNTLTITGTRNGNGIILGTIQRTHSFTTGAAYAFEGPDNTITFSALSGVTSVTVNVTTGSVTSFPYGASVNRVYDINVPAGTYTASLRLHYEDAELNGNDESTMQIWRYNGSAWSAAGATSRNASTNAVELTGLSTISNKWTLSDYAFVVRWNGNQSSNWNDPLNWTVVEGSPSLPPASTDIAEIGTAAFVNHPSINNNVTVKGIVFGSVQAVTLSLGSGGTLTTNGNITGRWNANAQHTISVGSQSMIIKGGLDLSDGIIGRTINLNIGSGSVTVNGSIDHSGNASVQFSNNGTLNIGAAYDYTSGSFIAGSGTVVYDGSSSQTIAALNYNHLTINKSGGDATVSSPIQISGNLAVNAGNLDLSASVTAAGNVTIAASGTVYGNTATINVGGAWTSQGSFQPNSGTVVLNGTGSQAVSAGSFNNFTINKASGNVALNGNVTVSGNVTISSGTLDLGTYTLHHNSIGGSFTLADGTSLIIGGSNNFPGNYAVYTLGATSTVHYNGTNAQVVKGTTYGHLQFSNGAGSNKTLDASANVNGDLTINAGAVFHSGNFTLSMAGNWTNSGNFIPGSGTVILTGTNKQITGSTTFNHYIVSGSYTITSGTFQYDGLLHITSTGIVNNGNNTVVINGDLIIDGMLSSSGIVTLSGLVAQSIRLAGTFSSSASGVINFNGNVSPVFNSTNTPLFASLNINNTAGIYPSVGWTCAVSFTIGIGASFHGGAYTHNFTGHFSNNGTITSSGTLNFAPGTFPVTVKLSGTSFASTGTVKFAGSMPLTISGTPTALNDVVIANTHSTGISPASAWAVGKNFSISSNAVFNAGNYQHTIGGNLESDGTLNGGSSTITLTSTAGSVSASTACQLNHLVISSGATIELQSGLRVGGNFVNNGVFDGSSGTLIMAGSNAATISSIAPSIAIPNLTIEKLSNGSVTLQSSLTDVQRLQINSGILDLGNYTVTQDAVSFGSLVVENAATLKVGGTNSLPLFAEYDLKTLSTVDYAGSIQTISTSASYGNLSLTTSGQKSAANALTVKNNIVIANATFVGGNYTHSVGGNWTMQSGGFTNSGTTILLNGSSDQTIQSTGAFQNLNVNKSTGLVHLGSNISINGIFTLSAGKVSLGSNQLILGSNAVIAGADQTKYLITGSTGSLVQPLTAGSSKVFPVGTASDYLPATVSFNAGAVTDNISVRVMNAVYENGLNGTQKTASAVNASWIMAEEVAGGSDASVTLQWAGSLEMPGFVRSAARMALYTGSGWNYGNSDISASGSNPYVVTRSGINTFSVFVMSSFNALPVRWLSVKGRHENGKNIIEWGTAEEQQSLRFEIEGSSDGARFFEVGRVGAAGNSSTVSNYVFTDAHPAASKMHYRIRQVDMDGKFSFSKTITLTTLLNGIIGSPVGTLFTSQIKLQIQSASTKQLQLSVFDAAGRMLYDQLQKVEKGTNSVVIDAAGFASGMYFIHIKDGSENIISFKMQKQ